MGEALPAFEKTLREVKLLSHVNQVSRIIKTVVRNPIKFSLNGTLRSLVSQCLTYGTFVFLVSRHLLRSVWRWFRHILSLTPLSVGFGPSFYAVVSSYAFVVF